MIEAFLQKYFLEPMGHYYTAPATLVYALLFAVSVFLVYRYVLSRLPFDIDRNFLYSLVPFIVLGGLMRVLEDAMFYRGYFFVSPGIYITLFFITLGSFLVSLLLEKYWKKPYHFWMLVFGSLFCIFNIYHIFTVGFENPMAAYMIFGLVGLWSLVLFPVVKFFPKYLSRFNYLILLTHIFDGSATFVSTSFYGYVEQHVVPRIAFGLFGPWVMFPLKIGVVWGALYGIDEWVEDENFRIWLKIAVLILGLALGVRNTLRVSMLV